jgi:hypothetical protein
MSESQAVADTQEMNWFWKELGADVSDTLTVSQRAAIEEVVKKSTAQAQPADVRLHLGKYYVRIIAGKERRSADRLKEDLKNNPIFASKNAAVIAVFWTLLLFATLYAGAFVVNFAQRFIFN